MTTIEQDVKALAELVGVDFQTMMEMTTAVASRLAKEGLVSPSSEQIDSAVKETYEVQRKMTDAVIANPKAFAKKLIEHL